ncbi:hypothetical protein [Chromobacterium aquaticum]|uniref:Uncharacterized protein n=1 Tax=Chromobacterium aquaticum TaxID=467180 RepID=A0ABV8ZL82_9NEIS|nr:hypothetical protein [Chromobacterium aquaticum]MCD5361245.1 hypothetical protein [Chromobacterium aquaticum]
MTDTENYLSDEALRKLLGSRLKRKQLLNKSNSLPLNSNAIDQEMLFLTQENPHGIELLGKLNEERFCIGAERQFSSIISFVGQNAWLEVIEDFLEHESIPPAVRVEETLSILLGYISANVCHCNVLGKALLELEKAKLTVLSRGGSITLQSCSPLPDEGLLNHPLFSGCNFPHRCVIYGDVGSGKIFRRRESIV